MGARSGRRGAPDRHRQGEPPGGTAPLRRAGLPRPLSILYWRDGSLGAFLSTIFGYRPAHPGSAALVYGLVHLIGGEPLAAISQLPFAFLGVAGVAAFARRSGLGPSKARIAGLAFLIAPIVVLQAGFRNNGLVGASLVSVTAALAMAPSAEWDRRRAALVGLGLGLMAATKLALLPAIAASPFHRAVLGT